MSGPRYCIIPADALGDARITDLHLRVLGDFGCAADRNGWLQANQSMVAKRLGRSRETVNRTIRDLVEWGYLNKRQRFSGKDGRQMINDYQVVMDRAERTEPPQNQQPVGVDGAAPCDPAVTGGCDPGITGGVTPEDHRGCDLQTSHHKNDPLLQRPSSSPPGKDIEREARANEIEDPKKVEAEGWALLKNWPGFDGMPKEPAMRIWRTLSADERATARRRFLGWITLLRKQKKSHVPAPSTYLTERLWEAVPDPQDAPPAPMIAPALGKAWGALRTALLLGDVAALPSPNSFIARIIADGGEMGRREELARKARYGFPMVNRMHRAVEEGQPWVIRPGEEPAEALLALMAACKVGSEEWRDWERWHADQGWPWLPDPGRQDYVWLPAGGPAGLTAFQQAMRGEDDAGGREAAE